MTETMTAGSFAASSRASQIASWLCQLLAAGILVQTLYFKFTYAPETRIIFAQLGGRPAATAAGLAELACVLLLLVPSTAALGALASLAVIGGALATHVFVIGIRVTDPATGRNDGGLLFALALVVALAAVIVAWLRRAEIVELVQRLRS